MISQRDLRLVDSADALLRLAGSRPDGDTETFVRDLDNSVNALLRSDINAALEFIREIQRIGRWLPVRYRPRITAMLARYQQAAGAYRKAAVTYEKALAVYRRQRDFVNAARVGRALTEVYMYVGAYDDALRHGRAAVRYFKTAGLSSDVARTLTNLGNVYHRQDKNLLALRHYDRARAYLVAEGGASLATVDYNRANVLANMNDLESAHQLYASASAAFEQSGMTLPALLATYSIAYLLFLKGDYSQSLALFEEVGQRFDAAGDARSSALTRLDLVELNVRINQYGTALLIGEETGRLFHRMGLKYEEGRAQYFMALAELSLGDLERAVDRLDTAEKLFQQEQNILWQGMVCFARNQLHLATGDHRAAEAASESARDLFVRSGDERRRIDADIAHLHALALAGGGSGFRRKAAALLRRDLAGYQRYRLHHVLGEYAYRRDDYEAALEHFREAVAAVERMIADLYQDEIRYFFLVDKYETYARVVDCLIKLDRVSDACMENLNALSLLHQRPVPMDRLKAEVPERLVNSIAHLRSSLARLSQFPRHEERGGGRVAEFVNVEQKLWSLERRARTYLYPETPQSSANRPTLSTEFRPAADETILSFVVHDDLCGLFVITSDQTKYVPLTVGTGALKAVVRKLSFVLELGLHSRTSGGENNRLLAEQLLELVYHRIIEPVEPLLSTRRLVIVLDGFLGQIPFPALRRVDGRSLKDCFDIRLIVDPGRLDGVRRSTGSLAGCRNAVFTVPSPALPSVEIEGENVRNVYPKVHMYHAGHATSGALRTELQKADGYVHIATHASRSSENPLFSRLLMSDGPFFPFDLFGTGIKAQLVVLSGCQTAAPGLNYGNSFSLAKAFHQAGSRFVIASLWPVADRLAMTYMSEFYTLLKKHKDIPTAFHQAMSRMQRQEPNPALWGAFVLIGR
jgi:CHAT domain-containing protein